MRFFDLGFARMRYHDLPGAGVPLLFVHGLGCASSCDYPAVSADPALADRRRILLDLLGAGFSDRPSDFVYTVNAHAQCVTALIDELGFEAIDLFGHSAGGAIAITAVAYCKQLRSLVLSEPNLDNGGGVFSRAIARQSEADFVRRGHDLFVREAQREGDAIWAGSLAACLPCAVHRLAVSLVEGCVPSWREQLYALSIPRTVIFGERSLPDPDVERLQSDGIPVCVVPNAGHSMATENPSGLAQAIRQSTVE